MRDTRVDRLVPCAIWYEPTADENSDWEWESSQVCMKILLWNKKVTCQPLDDVMRVCDITPTELCHVSGGWNYWDTSSDLWRCLVSRPDEQTDVWNWIVRLAHERRTNGRSDLWLGCVTWEKDGRTDGIRRKKYRRLPFVTVPDKIKFRVPECNLGNGLLKVVRVIDLLIEITR